MSTTDLTPPPSRRRAPHARLLLANVALLVALAAVSLWPSSLRATQPARARGEYTMVAGKPNSGSSHIVYILDSSNQEMVSLKYDTTNRRFQATSFRSLDTDAKFQPGR
jgi:hypothetical protein